MALGGDQGGSIRTPAAACGIVGLKPTYGLVPYTGIMPMEFTLDHTGPMARTVHDAALMLEVGFLEIIMLNNIYRGSFLIEKRSRLSLRGGIKQLPLRLSTRQSLSPTALFRTTLTRTITLDKLLILLGSNNLLYKTNQNLL